MNGEILGDRYELIEKIGDGGMAVVYKARCRVLDRIVAVKILKSEYANNNSFVEKFKTEAQAAARLSHPNIVNIFDVGQEGDVYYIVMEYVEGKTLKEIIYEEAPLPVDQAVNIAIMICDGIHHAHERGIIHKDIKPHNILVTRDGIVKVADFGIAQAISKKTITYGGKIVGSVHYISPEQARGEPLTRATDIYSLGCVLYEMLTGKVPFDAESPITVALKHIHDEPVPPRRLNENIPAEVENTILRAMDKVPSRRFSSAEYMRNSLLGSSRGQRAYDNSRPGRDRVMAMPEYDYGEDEGRTGKRKLKPWVLTAIIAVLGLLSGVFFMMGGSLFGKEVEVPSVKGMQISQAQKTLEDKGLYMDIAGKQFSDEFDTDEVISQNPSGGEKVKTGRHISVVISEGSQKVKVPAVVGRSVDSAEIALQNAGFNVDKEEDYDDKFAEGFVISQDPRENSRAEKGSTVTLLVSKGPEPEQVAMPDIIGLTVEEATKKLEDVKLEVGEQKPQDSTLYFKNTIISASSTEDDGKTVNLTEGLRVDEGTTVNLLVSNGPGPTAKTRTLEFTLPGDADYYKVVIIINDAKSAHTVYNELHPGLDQVSTFITYYGKGTAEIQLNGKLWKTEPL